MAASDMPRFHLYSAVLCVVVAVCYLKALDCGFVFDDASAIVDNKDLRPRTPWYRLFLNDFWGTPMNREKSHKSYRPLCVLTFRLNYAWNELEPMSYHLVNVITHVIVCVMFMRVCLMFMNELSAFIAALLFAVHPIHTEAVTGVVGRAETLSSIFFLAAILVYSKCTGYHRNTAWGPLLGTIALVTIAMLCKEQGITVIGVCVVYELFVAQRAEFKELWRILITIVRGKPDIPPWLRGSIVRSVVLVGSTMFLMIARIKVMGAQLPVFTKFDNPASVSDTPDRQLTYNYLLPINAWLLLCPAELFCDWTMGTIPVISGLADPRNLITLLFYVCMAKIVVFSLSRQGPRNRTVIMSLALMVMPFIPASNLFFPVGFVVAERILYTPSMGFCMIVALGFEILLQNVKSLKPLFWSLMAFMLLSQAVKTFDRNREWTSEFTLFKSALKFNHRNAKLWNNVGHALENEQRWSDALAYFERAARAQPDDIGAHMNVGRTYKKMDMFPEAEKAFLKAKALFPPIIPGKSYKARVAPNHLNVFLNLASLFSKDPTRLLEADSLLEQAITMRNDYVEAYINRGDIKMKLGRHHEAIDMYHLALKYEPDTADVHYNLAVVYMELDRKDKAKEHFEMAVNIDPDHWLSLYNSAVMIQEAKLVKEWPVAVSRLHQVMKMKPNESKPPFTMAMLAMDTGDMAAAEIYYKKALDLEPTMASSLFNLALLLTNTLNRPKEAVPYLQRLIEHYPDHKKAYLLMGELSINTLRDLDAAETNFKAALDLDPGNTDAMHNVCVVYVERGDLFRAEKCLAEVHKLAPEEEYIFKHLQIVRSRINQALEQQKKAQANSPKQQAQQAASKGVDQKEGQ